MAEKFDADSLDEEAEIARYRREGKEARVLGAFFFWLYGVVKRRFVRAFVLNRVRKFEGGEVYSVTLRRILRTYHGVSIGMYSGLGCFTPGNFRKGTLIGRYTSIYPTAQSFGANHPMNLKSTHAFLFNPAMGYTKEYLAPETQLTIGSDVWIGHNAIILPSVENIGDGAVIGAGAVVHKDIPPFAVFVGNPGRVVRYRFEKETIAALLEEAWWEQSIDDLLPEFETFSVPLEGGKVR